MPGALYGLGEPLVDPIPIAVYGYSSHKRILASGNRRTSSGPTTPPCRNLKTKYKIQFHPAVSKLLLRIISFSATRPWQVIDSLKPVRRVPVANVTHALSDIAAMLSKTTPPPTPDGPSGEPARVITVRERKLVRGFVLPVFCVIGCHLSSLLVLADVYPL